MLIYILFYLIIFLLSFKIQKKKWGIFDFVFLGLMVLIAGLRYGIGTDYNHYRNLYDIANTLDYAIDSRTGIGYFSLTYLFNIKLHLGFPIFIFAVSFITNFFIYRFAKENAERPGLVMVIYVALGFYTFSFNGFRQSLATAFAIYGLGYLLKKKKIRGIIFYGIGALIHSIALVPIIGFTIMAIKPKIKIRSIYAFVVIIAAFILYDVLYPIIVSNIQGYNLYVITADQYAAGIGTYINVLFYIFIYFFIICSNREKLKKYSENNAYFIKLTTLGIVINLFATKNWLFNRVAYPFLIFTTFVLASYYDLLAQKNDKTKCTIFHIAIMVYFIANIISFNDVVPYKSIFSLLS